MEAIASHANDVIGTQFSFTPVNIDTMQRCTASLRINKATGPDDIPAKIIQLARSEISPIMCSTFNDYVRCNVLPDIMKRANASPIFKKLDMLGKEKYRPISVFSAMSKVFETLLAQQLTSHFDCIFSEFLSAYRKGYSCDSALLCMTDSWRKALDGDMYVGTLATDLSKAFYCLPHALLVAKCKAYNVSNDACTLVANYLSNRKQRVKIANTKSAWANFKGAD